MEQGGEGGSNGAAGVGECARPGETPAAVRVLALDISSTTTGWAVLEGVPGPDCVPKLVEYGSCKRSCRTDDKPYPLGYMDAASEMGGHILDRTLVIEGMYSNIDHLVIEETNQGKARYTQKLVEWVHLSTLHFLRGYIEQGKVLYVSSRDWRQTLQVNLSKDDKKQNARLARAKRAGKKLEGVRGRVNKKHVAIRWVNQHYELALKVKDNDIADAICLGVGWFRGAAISSGTD